jgi:hypothetical protein
MASSFACRETRNKEVPDELLGIWTTDNSRYQGRHFEFTTEGMMAIGTGGGNVDTYFITNIESVENGALTDYTVTYLNRSGDEYKFHFRHDPFENGIITFTNQKALKWRRKEP